MISSQKIYRTKVNIKKKMFDRKLIFFLMEKGICHHTTFLFNIQYEFM